MIIAYNSVLDGGILTASGEKSGFPAAYVQHPFLIRRWRSLTNGASSIEWVKFDAGTGAILTLDTVAIIQHNLSATAVVHVQANATDDWTTPAVDIAMGIEDLILGHIAIAHRFVRFTFCDAASVDGYIEIGRIFGCMAYAVEEPIDNSFIDDLYDPSVVTRNESGQVYADLGQVARVYTLSMGTFSDDVRMGLKAVYASVGKSNPLILIPDEHHQDKIPPIYCTITRWPKFTSASAWGWTDGGIELTEAF
jgi:hypothetical protein